MDIRIRQALASVSDKTGLAEFARSLALFGVSILSTGGTAKLLASSGVKVTEVADYTGADGVMIGRAAQGAPWIFREIEHFLATGRRLPPPSVAEVREVLIAHLAELHEFYGAEAGVRIARKHVGWYVKPLAGSAQFREALNRIESCEEQLAAVERYLDELAQESNNLRCDNKEELAA